MLSTSKVLSFIDNKEGFIVYFFEGQKLIHDLAIIHDLKGEGFHFLRDSILGSQPLSVLLKPKENFGFYIDSEKPYFRFKIETNYNGYMRTLLTPEDITTFPEKISGIYRVSKITEDTAQPYNTVIKIEDKTLEEITNQLFQESFQINGKIYLSKTSDQSIFLMKLPNTNVDKEEIHERISLTEYWNKNKVFFEDLFSQGHNDQLPIMTALEQKNLTFLGSKDIQFKCSCSHERMVMGIMALLKSTSKHEVFEGDESLELKCDYCKVFYVVTEKEVMQKLKKT